MKKFRLTPPQAFVPSEYDEQVIIFDYARLKAKQDPRWRLLFATLNGVRLPIGLAVKAKRAGMVVGIPDIVLAAQGYAGVPALFIELKRTKLGHVTEEQKEFHEMLRQQGFQVEVCRGAKEAIRTITEYLGGNTS